MNVKLFLLGVLIIIFSTFILFLCGLLIEHCEFVSSHLLLQIPMISFFLVVFVSGCITLIVSVE